MAQGIDPRYFYSGTDVPINKLDVRDPKLFSIYEKSALTLRSVELTMQQPALTFDTEHVKEIHGRLHKDLFFWAGTYRLQRNSEGALEKQGTQIMQEVKRWVTQPPEGKERFIESLTASFMQLKSWSPFALGNDPTIRILITQAAAAADYTLQWGNTEIFNHAMIKAFNHDATALRDQFRTIAVPSMAVAFSEAIDKKNAGTAVVRYPKLFNAFETLRQAEAILSEDRGDQATHAARYDRIVERMKRELTEGRTPPEPTEDRLRQLLWFTRAFTRSA